MDSDYHHNFGANSWVLKDNESGSEVRIKSGHGVCPLLVGSSLWACTEHA